MSKTLGKNLHLCFSIMKRPQHPLNNSPQHNNSINNQKEQQQYYTSSPKHLTSTSANFTKNYNSLFEEIVTPPPSSFFTAPASPSSASEDAEMDEAEALSTPDLAGAYASCRFFISSPGRSNSIVDSLPSTSSSSESDLFPAVAGAVPVQTYSPDPYVDFRRSMQEMVEASEVARLEGKEAWVYLQELLLSYLTLNPKNTHKYIVRAFADLVVTVMSPNNGATSSSYFSSFGGDYCSDDIDTGEFLI